MPRENHVEVLLLFTSPFGAEGREREGERESEGMLGWVARLTSASKTAFLLFLPFRRHSHLFSPSFHSSSGPWVRF